jgi:hypothetical protein
MAILFVAEYKNIRCRARMASSTMGLFEYKIAIFWLRLA